MYHRRHGDDHLAGVEQTFLLLGAELELLGACHSKITIVSITIVSITIVRLGAELELLEEVDDRRLTIATLTMAILTMAIFTMAMLTMAILTMAAPARR